MIQHKSAINMEEISCILEPRLRRIIREELERIVQKEQKIFFLKPDSPLYDELLEISSRQMEEKNKFYSHAEVWGEC
jgi:hypothetical protein